MTAMLLAPTGPCWGRRRLALAEHDCSIWGILPDLVKRTQEKPVGTGWGMTGQGRLVNRANGAWSGAGRALAGEALGACSRVRSQALPECRQPGQLGSMACVLPFDPHSGYRGAFASGSIQPKGGRP